jgi:uncharacterized protein involved in copper resistance
MTSMTRTRRIVSAAVALAVAIAVIGVILLASRPASSAMPGMDMSQSSATPSDHGEMPGMDMSGMDHGSGAAPAPSPSGSAEMPGMDMSGMDHGSGAAPAPSPSGSAEMPGMDMPGMDHAGSAAESAQDRPLVPVLGAFGGGTSAVLLTAGLMRRKDRARLQARATARAEARSRK